jgi:hypothetical protein
MNEQEYQKTVETARERLRPKQPDLSVNPKDYETEQHAIVAHREKRLARLQELGAPNIIIQNEQRMLRKATAARDGEVFDEEKDWEAVQEKLQRLADSSS